MKEDPSVWFCHRDLPQHTKALMIRQNLPHGNGKHVFNTLKLTKQNVIYHCHLYLTQSKTENYPTFAVHLPFGQKPVCLD